MCNERKNRKYQQVTRNYRKEINRNSRTQKHIFEMLKKKSLDGLNRMKMTEERVKLKTD